MSLKHNAANTLAIGLVVSVVVTVLALDYLNKPTANKIKPPCGIMTDDKSFYADKLGNSKNPTRL